MKRASWIIVNKDTDEAEMEIFSEKNKRKLEALLNDKYKIMPVNDYLQSLQQLETAEDVMRVDQQTLKKLADQGE